MLLLITSEFNITSDFIVLKYGNDIFRLNTNAWTDYRIAFTQNGWEISNIKNGRSINSVTVTGALWWKAFSTLTDDDNYVKEEIKYIITDIYGWCLDAGIVKGNPPFYHKKFGKLTILGKAKNYFLTPPTVATVGLLGVDTLRNKSVVAKSLSSEPTNEKKVLMTTEVDVSRLNPAYPWCLQEKIDSAWDVTVFDCNRRCFPFKRDRTKLKGLDWRAEQFSNEIPVEWRPFELHSEDERRLQALSDDLNIEFGRYDFLTSGRSDQLVFLELNANGQWLFLDPESKHGLLECVVSWLKGQREADAPQARVSNT